MKYRIIKKHDSPTKEKNPTYKTYWVIQEWKTFKFLGLSIFESKPKWVAIGNTQYYGTSIEDGFESYSYKFSTKQKAEAFLEIHKKIKEQYEKL